MIVFLSCTVHRYNVSAVAAVNTIANSSSMIENISYDHLNNQELQTSSILPPHSSEHVVITFNDFSELGSINEEEEQEEEEKEVFIERSQTCTPELPPRTEEMMHIIAEDGTSLSSHTTPSPSRPDHVICQSNHVTLNLDHVTPNLNHECDHVTLNLNHECDHVTLNLDHVTPNLNHECDHVTFNLDHVTPNLNHECDHVTDESSPHHLTMDEEAISVNSYKIMIPATPQLVRELNNTTSSDSMEQPSGQTLDAMEVTENEQSVVAVHTNIPSTSCLSTHEEQRPPPRPPRPSPTKPGMKLAAMNILTADPRNSPPSIPHDSDTADNTPLPLSLPTQHSHRLPPPLPQDPVTTSHDPHITSHPISLHSTHTKHSHRLPPPLPVDSTPSPHHISRPPPPIHLPSHSDREHKREFKRTLPPRNIKRYPTSSSGSNSSNPGNVRLSCDEGAGEEEEDVFLKFNESYHSFHSHKFSFF